MEFTGPTDNWEGHRGQILAIVYIPCGEKILTSLGNYNVEIFAPGLDPNKCCLVGKLVLEPYCLSLIKFRSI